MGNINIILAALFCATAPVSSTIVIGSKTEITESNFKLGKESVSTVRSAYENGMYSEFLREMDGVYAGADLKGLLNLRSKEVPLTFQEEWEEKFADLQKERNEKLLAAIADTDDSPFAKKVRSLASNFLTSDQEKAISRLNAFIAKSPESGANADENKLIEIDLEYEYKLLHAEYPTSDVSPEERAAYQLALRMEKMDKMVEASKNFEDHSLKQAVGIAAATLDERLARNIDGTDLNRLIREKVKPANATEEAVFSTLSAYQSEFADLMKQIDAANR